jgi:hypothetical protein
VLLLVLKHHPNRRLSDSRGLHSCLHGSILTRDGASGKAGAAKYVEVRGMQLEKGRLAIPYWFVIMPIHWEAGALWAKLFENSQFFWEVAPAVFWSVDMC